MIGHFKVDVDGEVENARVLRLYGELDLAAAPMLRDVLDHIGTPELVIVDLSELEFIDSTGIGVLVAAYQHAVERGGRLAFVKGSGQVAQLLGLTGLSEQLPVAETLAELLSG